MAVHLVVVEFLRMWAVFGYAQALQTAAEAGHLAEALASLRSGAFSFTSRLKNRREAPARAWRRPCWSCKTCSRRSVCAS